LLLLELVLLPRTEELLLIDDELGLAEELLLVDLTLESFLPTILEPNLVEELLLVGLVIEPFLLVSLDSLLFETVLLFLIPVVLFLEFRDLLLARLLFEVLLPYRVFL